MRSSAAAARVLCAAASVAALTGARATAAAPPLRAGWSSVIVQINDSHGGGEMTARREAGLRALGGYVYRRLPLIHAAGVRVPAKNAARLAVLPWVAHVSPDRGVKKSDEFTVEHSGADVAFGQQSLTGSGVTVAVLDSGVRRGHPDFGVPGTKNTRVIAEANFVPLSRTADDACGHGTHVAGIIAGNGQASSGSDCFRTFYGVARRANLVNVRVLDGEGRGDVSAVIAGLQWVVNNRSAYKIRVVNLSLGHPVGESYQTDPLCQAVEAAYRSGIVVVCAAGNTGRVRTDSLSDRDNEGWGAAYGSIQSPANDPYVLTVGAMKSSGGSGKASDRIATYSSRGPSRLDFIVKPDLVAPGNQVIAPLANNSYLEGANGGGNVITQGVYSTRLSSKDSNKYFRLSGTSMAAPVVSGAVALLLQKDPTLLPDTIKARLMLSADKRAYPNGMGDACTFGAGSLNIPAALANRVVATRPALSPALYQDNQGNVDVRMDRVIWGESGLWGTQTDGLHVLWGESVVWGENTLLNSNVLWGENVWSDRVIRGETSSAVDLTSTAIQGDN